MALPTERPIETTGELERSPFADSVEYRRPDGAVVRADYCQGLFHVWYQPRGERQNFWLGQTADREAATELMEALMGGGGASLRHALHSALAQLNGDAWRRN